MFTDWFRIILSLYHIQSLLSVRYQSPCLPEKYIWLIAKDLANSVPPTRTHCVGGFCLWEFVLLHRQRTETGFDGAP